MHKVNGLDIEGSDETYFIVGIDYITRIDLMPNKSALILIEDVGHLPSFSSPDFMAFFLFIFIESIWVVHYRKIIIGGHSGMGTGYKLNHRQPDVKVKYPETYSRESKVKM